MADITYESLKNIASMRTVPILTLDPRWYQLVPDNIKTDEVRYWENKVNELLKKQGRVTNDIKEVKKIKSKLIKDVVDNMEGDGNDKKRQKLMSQNQRLIYEAKDKLAQLEDEERELPRELSKANQRLLAETAKLCYRTINENKADLEVLDKWINATRIKLKKNLLIKQDKENQSQQIYSGLHDILGPEVMSELDRINDKEEE